MDDKEPYDYETSRRLADEIQRLQLAEFMTVAAGRERAEQREIERLECDKRDSQYRQRDIDSAIMHRDVYEAALKEMLAIYGRHAAALERIALALEHR